MTYTAPTTFAVGDEFTASWQNTYIKANLDFLATPPSVRATASSTTAIATGTWSLIAFDAETWDWATTAMHDNSTNNSRLVAPVAGKYQVTAHTTWTANATGSRVIQIRKNAAGNVASGTQLSQSLYAASASQLDYQVTDTFDLAANDYIEIWRYQNSGGNLAPQLYGTTPAFATMRWVGF